MLCNWLGADIQPGSSCKPQCSTASRLAGPSKPLFSRSAALRGPRASLLAFPWPSSMAMPFLVHTVTTVLPKTPPYHGSKARTSTYLAYGVVCGCITPAHMPVPSWSYTSWHVAASPSCPLSSQGRRLVVSAIGDVSCSGNIKSWIERERGGRLCFLFLYLRAGNRTCQPRKRLRPFPVREMLVW